MADVMPKKLKVKIGDSWHTVEVVDLASDPVRVLVDGDPVDVVVERRTPQDTEQPPTAPEPAQVADRQTAVATTPSAIKVFRSPMPGVIMSVAVKEGDQVVTGDEVCILEAMKMQQVLRADWTGIVTKVHVIAGQQVLDGAPIVELE